MRVSRTRRRFVLWRRGRRLGGACGRKAGSWLKLTWRRMASPATRRVRLRRRRLRGAIRRCILLRRILGGGMFLAAWFGLMSLFRSRSAWRCRRRSCLRVWIIALFRLRVRLMGRVRLALCFTRRMRTRLRRRGCLRFTIFATPELGTVSAFPVEMTVAVQAGSSAGRISYRGEEVRHQEAYAAGEVGNVLNGAVRLPTLIYEGQRRGLHVLRTRLGDYADGWQENVCATGAREGWRLPTFGEAAGLLSDSDLVSVAVGDDFVESDAAAYDSSGGEFPLAAAAELLAGVYASVYFADGSGGVIGDDGNGGLSLSDGVGYVVCVSEVSLLSYEPRKILSGVTLHSAYPEVSAVRNDAPFLTVTLRSYVNHRGGDVNDGAFSVTVMGDFAGTFSYSGGGVGEVELSAPSESSSGSATLWAFPAYGSASEFVVRGLRSAPLTDVSFGGSVVASGGEVETTLGVTLRYAGHRRGLHILIGTAIADGSALARDYCATGSDEGWRVPGLAESFGLLIDSDSVAVSRPGLGTLSGVVSGADVLPGWDSLASGRTVLLPSFDAGYYAASTLTGAIAADAFALHSERAHAAMVRADEWSFFGNEKVSPVCVLSDSDSGYVRPPDVRGVGVSLGAFDFPESVERMMTIGLLLTLRAEACRYAYDGSQDCSEIPKFQMSSESAGLTLVSGGDGRATLLGDSRLLRNAQAVATVLAETQLGGGFSRSYVFVRPSLAAEFAGEWLLPGAAGDGGFVRGVGRVGAGDFGVSWSSSRVAGVSIVGGCCGWVRDFGLRGGRFGLARSEVCGGGGVGGGGGCGDGVGGAGFGRL